MNINIMKIRSILFATLGVAVMASCTGRVSDVTEITGTVVPENITDVKVVLGTVVDTLVPVTDGRFTVTVPTDMSVLGVVSVAHYAANFIADGTPLTIVLDEKSTVTSKYPKISVQERLNAFSEADAAYAEEYGAKRMEISADTLLTDEEKQEKFQEFYASFMKDYKSHNEKAYLENTDNFISLFALQNLRYEYEDAELDSLLNLLVPELQEHSFVKSMKEAVAARVATSEGKMFTDFTVNSVVGMTRSIPPQPKYAEVKFSDYVGKGKYVLVDFWAPWCGPCKREIPNIRKVYEKYADKGFEVLSIAVWERQPVEVTINTAAELGMDWQHINNAGSVPTSIYGIEGIPHLMLIGPDGTILKRGFHGLDGIEAAVSEYLK